MKADPWQQHHLRKLVELDTELARAAHRAANLAEQKRVDELTVAVTAAEDAVAVVVGPKGRAGGKGALQGHHTVFTAREAA